MEDLGWDPFKYSSKIITRIFRWFSKLKNLSFENFVFLRQITCCFRTSIRKKKKLEMEKNFRKIILA